MRGSTIIILTIVVAVFLGMAYVGYNISTEPIESEYEDLPELDISIEPIQTDAKADTIPNLERGNKTVIFTPLAHYRIAALLVSKHKYTGNFMNRLSPCDFALAWGEIPNQLEYIKFKQMIRYCKYNIEDPTKVDPNYLACHMSNNHLIPANNNIRHAIRLAKKGMKVELEGYLVGLEVMKKGKPYSAWRSSVIRTDSGGGACELIYLTKLRIEDKVYE